MQNFLLQEYIHESQYNSDPMKCPKCNKKMIFNREIKDYYCQSCKSPLRELKKKDEKEIETSDIKKTSEEHTEQETILDAGTDKGIQYMMLGSVVVVINLLLPPPCQIIGIIGIFILTLGFWIVFKDRKKYSLEHRNNMKIAAILFIIWIIIMIFTNIYNYQISSNLTNEISDLKDSEIVPNKIIINLIQDSKIITLISLPTLGIFAIYRYLTIGYLIPAKVKKILIASVFFIIITGFFTLSISLNYTDHIINNLEDTTKEDFYNNDYNLTTDLDPTINYVYYTVLGLSIISEITMILCYYWTYRELYFKKE